MKFFKIDWNCSLLPMTFLMSLSGILSKTIGLNAFRESYDILFGFGIIMDKNVLKWEGQWPRLIQVLAILIIFQRHSWFWMMILIYLQDNLSGLGVDILLYFKIALLNSSSEKGFQLVVDMLGISSSKSMFIWWIWAELNDRWSAWYKSSILKHSWPSY